MEQTYVILRLMANGQSHVELTTDDMQFAQNWVRERTNAVDGVVTNYQILPVPFMMPASAPTDNARYVNTDGGI
jgi:hypothetical protein